MSVWRRHPVAREQPLEPDDLHDRLDELFSSNETAPLPRLALASPAPSWPEPEPPAPGPVPGTGIDMPNIDVTLKEALAIEGAQGVALVDSGSGMALGTA